MSSSEIKSKKCNSYTTKLFNLILTLNPEQQRFLLKNVEKLILKEKRIAARKNCRIPVRYLYNTRIYTNFLINISRDGCFIETQEPVLIGENILIDIQLDGDDKPIRIKGEVANANRWGIGIEFKEIKKKSKEKLGYLLYKIL